MRLIRPRNESGSIIVAISVMSVVTMLSVAVVTRTISHTTNVKESQNYAAALGKADAGLSDALLRIDQLGTSSAADFCVGSGSTCTVASVPGSPTTEYVADALDSNTYLVKAKGFVNGRPHAVQARIQRQLAFPFAIFGKSLVDFNGKSGFGVHTVTPDDTVLTDPPATVGSNGSVTCSPAGVSPSDKQITYAGGSSNCPVHVQVEGSYNPLPPATSCPAPANTPATPCYPTTASPGTCPGNGVISGTIDPGVYRCTGNVTFSGTVTVGPGSVNGGVVELFVFPSSGTGTVNMTDADVNFDGDPTKFRTYVAGSGGLNPGGGSLAARYTGIMYAPNYDLTSDGCQADWRGSLVVDEFTCNGGPHMELRYDTRVVGIVDSNWTLKNFKEIPAGQVVLP